VCDKPIRAILIVALSLHAATPSRPECGTYAQRAHEEVFLHRQHMAARARMKLAKATDRAAAQANQDAGQVAIIDDSAGVIDRRNVFNLDGRTLTFQPVSAGYRVTPGADTFDSDASSAGTKIENFTDDDTRPLSLPFSFPFFGTSYRKLWINSNGYITFNSDDTNAIGTFGYFAGSQPAIAPLYTDLDPSQSSDGVRVLIEAGRVVITWATVPLYGTSLTQNFQTRLYPDGRIDFAYRSVNPREAVVGLAKGNGNPVELVDFSAAPTGTFSGGVAEFFTGSDAVDIISAAQKFYQTHDDAYDYLVFYNAEGVGAGPGVVAYESTVRSTGQGYGDGDYDYGAVYGSKRRLKSVMNLGPISQYPANPNALVPARGGTGDTPLTILGHEAGHLYLASVSVANPSDPEAPPPMLGRALVHWAFTFNSDASFLEGNQIADAGPDASPRFSTTATVQGYSALDQYLMGFRAPEEVPPMFAVLGSPQSQTRAPQTGVRFNGNRLDISIDDIVQTAGRRTPDSTVAQRRYRFAIVLIVPSGASPSPADIAQVDRYRAEFETTFSNATGGRAFADTSLKREVDLSLSPGAGVVAGADGTASIELATPAAAALTFTLRSQNGNLTAPASVTIPVGGTRVTFPVVGVHAGVEEFSAQPSDASYETAFARVQVAPTASNLRLTVTQFNDQIVLRVTDQNNLPYSGVRVSAAGGAAEPAFAFTGENGTVTFSRIGTQAGFTIAIDGAPASTLHITGSGVPSISKAQNGASFGPEIAAGGFVTLIGSNLTPGDADSTAVLVNRTPARVFYAAGGQINFVMPSELAPGPARIVVQNPLGSSDPLTVQVSTYAPGIFFNSDTGYGAIRIAGTADTPTDRPVRAGTYLEIYCTGLGPANAPLPKVQIGGIDAPVLYSGVTPIPGLYQVNVQVPNGVASGAQPLALAINGIASNTVKVLIAN
jgi:uncharacterized protein (TIGR03437 family)